MAAFLFSSTVKDNEGLRTPHKTLWSSKNKMAGAGAKGQGSVLSQDEEEERNIRAGQNSVSCLPGRTKNVMPPISELPPSRVIPDTC